MSLSTLPESTLNKEMQLHSKGYWERIIPISKSSLSLLHWPKLQRKLNRNFPYNMPNTLRSSMNQQMGNSLCGNLSTMPSTLERPLCWRWLGPIQWIPRRWKHAKSSSMDILSLVKFGSPNHPKPPCSSLFRKRMEDFAPAKTIDISMNIQSKTHTHSSLSPPSSIN